MLEIVEINKPEDKLKYLASFTPNEQTWLVSDLRTKFEIQARLFKTADVLEEDSILRASELWRKFIIRVYPDLNLISKDLSLTLLSLWLRDEAKNDQVENWQTSPGAAESLYAHMQQLLPILIQAHSRTQMPEWFEQNPEASLRWSAWYELGIRYLAKFIEAGLFPATWSQALLIEQDLTSHWSKNLIVDLNLEMTPLEAEIIWQISQTADVQVLVPHPTWIKSFESSFQGYFHLYDKMSKPRPEFPQTEFPVEKGRHEVVRLSSQAAEVKNAVAQVRLWLEQKVPLSEIALVAPEIEDYWPILRLYLEQEGIPFNKDRVSTLQSFLPFQRWLSRLRLGMKKIETEDLESHVFGQAQPLMKYEDFKILYTHIFDEDDLSREEKILQTYNTNVKAEDFFVRDDFLKWSLRFFDPDIDPSWLDQVFPVLLTEIPAPLSIPLKDWVFLLESRIAKREMGHTKGDLGGIQVVNLSSSEWLSSTQVLLLGLTDQNMKSRESTSLTQKDVQQILSDLGVVINPAENHNLEFEAFWLMEKATLKKLVLSTAETDFSGSVLSPSLIWLVTASGLDVSSTHTSLPQNTRWDEIKNTSPSNWQKLRAVSEERFERLTQRVSNDMGAAAEVLEPLTHNLQLSASKLESFAECPFIFKAEKLFRLSDRPELDLDLDPMNRGTLVHQVLNELLGLTDFLNLKDEDLLRLIDRVRRDLKVKLVDERFWPSLRLQTLKTLKDFIASEREWRSEVKTASTPGRELSFIFQVDMDSKVFQKVAIGSDAKIILNGKIDRVDLLQDGKFVVMDYKASIGGDHRHWKSWVVDPQEIQLALYAMAVEEGLSELDAASVAASLYHGLKQKSRNKGFIQIDGSVKPTSHNKISGDEKFELYSKLKELIFISTEKILKGETEPDPIKPEFCNVCKWRTQCRAAHLN